MRNAVTIVCSVTSLTAKPGHWFLLLGAACAWLAPVAVSAQGPIAAVVITVAAGKVTRIENPILTVWSSVGYLLGGRYQPLPYVGVTEPVDPPPGTQLTPVEVKLNDVSKLAWQFTQDRDTNGVVEITKANGSVESVYLWKQAHSGWERLYPCHFQIKGDANVKGKLVPVEVTQGEAAARGCQRISFQTIEFVR